MHKIWPNELQTLLLKAALLSREDSLNAWQEWARKIDLNAIDSASFNLLPLIAKNQTLIDQKGAIFDKCKGVYRHTWMKNQILWQKTLPLFTKFQEEGVEQIVLLKGMAMILKVYRDFGLRVIGDIDFLVQKSEAAKVGAKLEALGWKKNVTRFDLNNPCHLIRSHALNFTHFDKSSLDLHWSLLAENCPTIDEKVLKKAHGLLPDPTHLLFQVCIHGMKYSPTPLIRWIADSTWILNTSPINWDELTQMAQEANVSLPLKEALQYLKKHFVKTIPESVLYSLESLPTNSLQKIEFELHAKGRVERANWTRYCLNHRLFTVKSKLLHLPNYLQMAARLKSPWMIPPFAIYWCIKKIFKAAR